MPAFMKWEGVDGTSASSTSHARGLVTLTLVDWTSAHFDEHPNASAFDAYSADAHSGGANAAMGDGSVVFLLDHVDAHTHQPLPVLMVIADPL
jgi:prepilin-type processing-associated H-X9-DG protein